MRTFPLPRIDLVRASMIAASLVILAVLLSAPVHCHGQELSLSGLRTAETESPSPLRVDKLLCVDGLCQAEPIAESPPIAACESPDCDCVECRCDPCECPPKTIADEAPRVTLYSPATAYCHPCEQTKVWLRSNGIDFREVKTSKYNRFPRIEIDEDVIHGYDVVALSRRLGVKNSQPTAFASTDQGRPVFRNVVYGSPVGSFGGSCASCRR